MADEQKPTIGGAILAGVMGFIGSGLNPYGAALAVVSYYAMGLKSAKGVRKPPEMQSVYSIDTSSTQSDPRLPVPIIYGEMKSYGNYFHLTNGKPFNNSTVIEGAVGFCEGEISEINELRINNLEYVNINADIKQLNAYEGHKQQTTDDIFLDYSRSYNEGTTLAENASVNFSTYSSITSVKLGLLWNDGVYELSRGHARGDGAFFDVLYKPSGGATWFHCFEKSNPTTAYKTGSGHGTGLAYDDIVAPGGSAVYVVDRNPSFPDRGMQGVQSEYPFPRRTDPIIDETGFMLQVQTQTNMYAPGKSGYYKTWHSVQWSYSSNSDYVDMFDVTGNMVSNPTTHDMPFIVHQASGAGDTGAIGETTGAFSWRCAPIYIKVKNLGSTDIRVKDVALTTNQNHITAFSMSPVRSQYSVFSGCKRQKYDVKVINRCDIPLTVENWQEATDTELNFPYTAYAAFRFSANQQLQGKIPDLSAVIKGKTVNVYSVGSVGSYSNQYSANPVWCLTDFLLSDRYGCGQYFDETDLDLTSFFSAASVASTAGRELNYIIDSQQNAYQVIDAIAKVGRLFVYESGGKLFCGNDKAVASTTQSFDLDTIIEGSFNLSVNAQNNTYNRLSVQYFDKNNNYDRNTVIMDNDTDITSTGGVRAQTINAYGITDRTEAEKYGRYLLNYQNLGYMQTQIGVGYGGVKLEVGDVYEIKHPVPGWGYTQIGGKSVLTGSAGQLFRATKISETPGGDIAITGILYDADMYDETNIATQTPAKSTVPGLFETTAIAKSVRLTSEFVKNKNGQVQGNIIVNWQCDTAEYAIIDHYNIYQSRDNVAYNPAGTSKSNIFRHLAQDDDVEYYYKVCPVTIYGKEQPLNEAIKNYIWHKRSFTDNDSVDYLYMQLQGDNVIYEYEDVHTGNKDFDYYEMRLCDTNIGSAEAWDKGQVYKTNLKTNKLVAPVTTIGSHFLTLKARYKDSSWSDTEYIFNYNIASGDLTTKKVHDSFEDWASTYANRCENPMDGTPTSTGGTNDFLGWTGSNCIRLPDKDGGFLVMEHAFAASACTFAASSAEAQGITNVTPNINFNHAPDTYKMKYRTFWNLEQNFGNLTKSANDRVASGFLTSAEITVLTKETFDMEQTEPNIALLALGSNYNFSSLVNETIDFADIGGCTMRRTLSKTGTETNYASATWTENNTPDSEHLGVKAFVIDYEIAIPSPFQNIYLKNIRQDLALRKRFIAGQETTNGVGQWSYTGWQTGFYYVGNVSVSATPKSANVLIYCDKSNSAFVVNTQDRATGNLTGSIDFDYTVEGY